MQENSVVVVAAFMHFKTAINDPIGSTVRAALDRLVAATRAEDGCLEYAAHTRPDAPGEAFIFERWRDKAALDAHAASAHLAAFRADMAVHFAKPTDVGLWSRLG